VGLANSSFFIVLFVGDRLYADVILQAVYIVLGIYGWYMWLHGGRERSPLPISTTRPRQWLVFLAVFLAAAIAMALFLVWFARVSGLPPPSLVYWDSATTAACLVAQYMLARKHVENWIVWIATNVSYIALYLVKERPLLAFLQIIFIVLSVRGYRHWRREMAAS
jgi:nicotinamide mononucleotide transporter